MFVLTCICTWRVRWTVIVSFLLSSLKVGTLSNRLGYTNHHTRNRRKEKETRQINQIFSEYVNFKILISLEKSSWFSGSVVSDSLRPHGLQHAGLPCPSPSPGACWNSGLLSHWCHPTISSSVVPFSSWLQSCPASGSFPMSRLFPSGGQSIGASVA